MFEPRIFWSGRYLTNIVLITITQASKNINKSNKTDKKKSEIWARIVLGSGSHVTSIVIVVKVNPQNKESSLDSPESWVSKSE